MEQKDLDEQLALLLTLKKAISEKIPGIDDRFNEQFKLRMSLNKESDRGAVLLSVAYLENYLENALKSKLLGSQKHIKKLFDFNGALGTFSNKIDLSLSLGIINDKIYYDLNSIRKIRNIFAHNYDLLELASPIIKENILNLKLCPRSDIENSNPRQIFLSTVFFLIGLFQGVTLKKEKLSIDSSLSLLDEHIGKLRESK